jgi:hypothetical protein
MMLRGTYLSIHRSELTCISLELKILSKKQKQYTHLYVCVCVYPGVAILSEVIITNIYLRI